MRIFLRWLLRSWVRICRLLLHWLRPQARPHWPSPRTGGPLRRPHAQPKPAWVRQEIIRLKAVMPAAGCRTVAHCFNRRFAVRRQMTVGKTYVADTMRRQHSAILCARRRLKHRVPRLVPRNLIWDLDLAVKTDRHGTSHLLLAVVDHASRACLCLQRLTEKSVAGLLHPLGHALRRYGMPRYLRTDNDAIFTTWRFRVALRLLGITPQRNEPHCPWQNGRVERFIGTVKAALAAESLADAVHLDSALRDVRVWYNHVRPHAHLYGRTPAEVWAGVDVFAPSHQNTLWQTRWCALLPGRASPWARPG